MTNKIEVNAVRIEGCEITMVSFGYDGPRFEVKAENGNVLGEIYGKFSRAICGGMFFALHGWEDDCSLTVYDRAVNAAFAEEFYSVNVDDIRGFTSKFIPTEIGGRFIWPNEEETEKIVKKYNLEKEWSKYHVNLL